MDTDVAAGHPSPYEPYLDTLRPGEERAAYELNRLAFGGTEPYDASLPAPPHDRVIVVRSSADDRVMGKVVTLALHQWFGGRAVPMGGVSGVVCVPELRGRGVVRAMLHESLRRMFDVGEVISCLFPTTASLYRSVGYEVAGTWEWSELPMSELAALEAHVDGHEFVPIEFDDPRVRRLHEAFGQTQNGWLQRSDWFWQRLAHQLDPQRTPQVWHYLAMRSGEAVGHVTVTYAPDTAGAGLYLTKLTHVAAADGAALRALLGFCGRWGTTADRVRTLLPRHLMAHAVAHAQRISTESSWPWMARLVDVAGALRARGWAPTVTGEVHLLIHDPVDGIPSGPFVVRFADGTATVDAGGRGAIEIDVASLAAWYTGQVTATALAWQRRLDGATADDLALLDSVVSGPTPTGVDFF